MYRARVEVPKEEQGHVEAEEVVAGASSSSSLLLRLLFLHDNDDDDDGVVVLVVQAYPGVVKAWTCPEEAEEIQSVHHAAVVANDVASS